MKKLLLTIAIGPYHEAMGCVTHPTLQKYADKIGADFTVIREQKISHTTPHWEKFQIASFLDEYDRIIFFDTDIIVRGDCPNLFEIVPEHMLGAFDEAPSAGRTRAVLDQSARAYGYELGQWDGRYYNTGVLVLSKAHRNIFIKPEQEVESFYEQTYLNLAFLRAGAAMYDLNFRFNRMAGMNAYTAEHRLDSYVVHYAGYQDPDPRRVIEAIRTDIAQWRAAGLAV